MRSSILKENLDAKAFHYDFDCLDKIAEVQAGGPSKQQAIRNFTQLLLEEICDNPDYTYKPPSNCKESEKEIERFKKFVERAAGKEQVLEASIAAISF